PVPTAALHAELGRAVLHTRLDAEVGRSATPVHGQASLPIAQWQGAIALDLSARGLPVGDLPAPMRLDGRLAGGALDLAVTVRGERTHPITHADLKVQKVRVSGLADLDGSLALDAFGGVTHLVGELLVDGTRALSVRGQAQLDPGDLISEPGRHRWREAPLELALEAPRFDLSRLRQQMGLRGLVSGRGTMNGTLGHPVGRAHFAVEGASWGGLAWSRMGIDSTLDGWLWRTDFAADQLGGGRLDARLTVDPFARPRVRADLHARRLDIGVLRDFIPQLREVAGELGADLSVVGLFAAERQVSGAVTLTHGRVRPVGLRALQDVDLALSIHPGRCDITRLQAHSGGGTLHGQGSAELVGLHPRSVHLNATATQFLVGYGGFASGQLDGDLVVDAVTTPDLLSTRVRLEHGAIALPALETGRSLHRVGPLADVRFVDRAAARERADAHPVRIDLTLEVPDALHVSGRDIDADLHGGFALTGDGTGGRRATGMVEIQRGHVQVFGQRFEIERARMRWAGGPPGNPALDVRVSRQLPDALLVVALHGTLDRPELALSSDPPSYDQNQLASMVLSGQPPPAAPSASGSSANSVSAAGTISSAVLGQVIAQIAPALPVDVVRIDVAQDTTPAGAATGASTTKRYEVGKHLGDRIYVSYVRVAGAQQNQSGNEAHFEFRLRRQWVLESAIGDAGEGGLDLFWTYRY
ncbi:MAG TPA: translocation/assembly module TamB domain-containing protein, partial [Polyangia bacterium]|nr:translocation/assembly module TamB domain-containing protein [Polyangia bacterium]